MPNAAKLLQVTDLQTDFHTAAGVVPAEIVAHHVVAVAALAAAVDAVRRLVHTSAAYRPNEPHIAALLASRRRRAGSYRSRTSQRTILSRESACTRSRPRPQSTTSAPPPTARIVSLPSPPKIRSASLPPVRTSAPSPP